jgi:hypothetical protein
VGLAAAQANRGERLAAQGMASIAPADGLRHWIICSRKIPYKPSSCRSTFDIGASCFPKRCARRFLAQLLEKEKQVVVPERRLIQCGSHSKAQCRHARVDVRSAIDRADFTGVALPQES